MTDFRNSPETDPKWMRNPARRTGVLIGLTVVMLVVTVVVGIRQRPMYGTVIVAKAASSSGKAIKRSVGSAVKTGSPKVNPTGAAKSSQQVGSVKAKDRNGKVMATRRVEFRYFRFIKSKRHPNAKHNMTVTKNKDGRLTYCFTDSKGKTIETKQILRESPLLFSETDFLPVSKYRMDPNTHTALISIQFTPKATKRFAQFTKEHQWEYLAIIIEGKIMSIPSIAAPIQDGRVIISTDFKSLDEAQRLVDALNKRGLFEYRIKKDAR